MTQEPHGAPTAVRDQDLRNSIYDGALAHVYATLTGGVFLTGFALHLGLGEFLIGLLAAVPYLVAVIQLPASYHVVRSGRRKGICVAAARPARLLWLAIPLLALLPLGPGAAGVLLLLLLILSHALGTVSYISWLSWMTDLVPDGIRGRFFGTRNMLCGAAGMATALVFGQLLDRAGRLGPWGAGLGYASVFGVAVAAGVLGLRFLARVSEPPAAPGTRPESLVQALLLPLRDAAFRPYLLFGCLWGFSVQLASPFFTVYLLRDLGYGLGFVAGLGVLSSLADLVGMRVWGAVSDRVKNRPVIWAAGWVGALLPLGYLLLGPASVVLPILLHLTGGWFWAGINLCSSNLLLRLARPDQRALYFAAYAVVAGAGASLGPVLGGALAGSMGPGTVLGLLPLQVLILVSVALRVASLQLLRRVREPEEGTFGQMIRILRSVRSMGTSAGFAFLLHPFVEVSRDLRGKRGAGVFIP